MGEEKGCSVSKRANYRCQRREMRWVQGDRGEQEMTEESRGESFYCYLSHSGIKALLLLMSVSFHMLQTL